MLESWNHNEAPFVFTRLHNRFFCFENKTKLTYTLSVADLLWQDEDRAIERWLVVVKSVETNTLWVSLSSGIIMYTFQFKEPVSFKMRRNSGLIVSDHRVCSSQLTQPWNWRASFVMQLFSSYWISQNNNLYWRILTISCININTGNPRGMSVYFQPVIWLKVHPDYCYGTDTWKLNP